MIEDTSGRDPATNLAGLLARGQSDYITGMEADGQRQLVHSDQVPTQGSDKLAEIGFTLGDVVQHDTLFRHVTIPEGWTKSATEHSMWSEITDAFGRSRVSIFYKAAFYDRRAFCRVTDLREYVYKAVEHNARLVFDDRWATREAVIALLVDAIEWKDREIAGWRARPFDDGVAEIIHEITEHRAQYQVFLNRLSKQHAAD